MGSSASTIAGCPARARAIATRCRSPPDSWVGRATSLCPSPTRASAAAARSRRSARPAPAYSSPSATLASGGLVLGQEELLEHKPDPRGPQPGQLPVAQAATSSPASRTPPLRRPVQRARQVQQRGLARPRRARRWRPAPRPRRESSPLAAPSPAGNRDRPWSPGPAPAPGPAGPGPRRPSRPCPRVAFIARAPPHAARRPARAGSPAPARPRHRTPRSVTVTRWWGRRRPPPRPRTPARLRPWASSAVTGTTSTSDAARW